MLGRGAVSAWRDPVIMTTNARDISIYFIDLKLTYRVFALVIRQ